MALVEKEDNELIHNYILRTYLIKVLESDLKTIREANFKIHEPYIKLVEETLRRIRIDLRDIKVNMKKFNIKIEDPYLDCVDFWHYDYFVRGYKGVKRYWESALKLHCTKLLEEYFKGVDNNDRS